MLQFSRSRMLLRTLNIITILELLAFIEFISAAVPARRSLYTSPPSVDLVKNISVCWADNVAYGDGDIIPGAGPCEECVCNAPDVVCSMVKCEIKTGCKIIQKPNQCCPDYKCDCEYNGYKYNNGAKIDTSDTPCRVCYCKGGDVMCTTVGCYERENCEGKVVPGTCCPKYDHCPPLRVDDIKNRIKVTTTNTVTVRNGKQGLQPWLLTTDVNKTINSTNESPLTTDEDEYVIDSTSLPEKALTVIMKRIHSPSDVNLTTKYVPIDIKLASDWTMAAAARTETYYTEEDDAVTDETGISAASEALNTIKTSTNVAAGTLTTVNEDVIVPYRKESDLVSSDNFMGDSTTTCRSTDATLADDIITVAYTNVETNIPSKSPNNKINTDSVIQNDQEMTSAPQSSMQKNDTEYTGVRSDHSIAEIMDKDNMTNKLRANTQTSVRTTVTLVEDKTGFYDEDVSPVAVKLVPKGSNLTALLLTGVLTDSATFRITENTGVPYGTPHIDVNITSPNVPQENKSSFVTLPTEKGKNLTNLIFEIETSSVTNELTSTNMHSNNSTSATDVLELAPLEVITKATNKNVSLTVNDPMITGDSINNSSLSKEVLKLSNKSDSTASHSSKLIMKENETNSTNSVSKITVTSSNGTIENDSAEGKEMSSIIMNSDNRNANSTEYDISELNGNSSESSKNFFNYSNSDELKEVIYNLSNNTTPVSVITDSSHKENSSTSLDSTVLNTVAKGITDPTVIINNGSEVHFLDTKHVKVLQNMYQNASSSISESPATEMVTVTENSDILFHISSENGAFTYTPSDDSRREYGNNTMHSFTPTISNKSFKNDVEEINLQTIVENSTQSDSITTDSLAGGFVFANTENNSNQKKPLTLLPFLDSISTTVYSNFSTISGEISSTTLLDDQTEEPVSVTKNILQNTSSIQNSSIFDSDYEISVTTVSSDKSVSSELSSATSSSSYVNTFVTELSSHVSDNTSGITGGQLNENTNTEPIPVNNSSDVAISGITNDSYLTSENCSITNFSQNGTNTINNSDFTVPVELNSLNVHISNEISTADLGKIKCLNMVANATRQNINGASSNNSSSPSSTGCLSLNKSSTLVDENSNDTVSVLERNTYSETEKNFSGEQFTTSINNFDETNFSEIQTQKFLMHPIKLINSVHSVHLSPGLGIRERPVPNNNISFMNNSNVLNSTAVDAIQKNLVNETSSLKLEDPKSMSTSWLNSSSAVYKILLDGNIKPLTRPPNSTMAPLSWLKGSIIASDNHPTVENTSKLSDVFITSSNISQKSRSDVNVTSENTKATAETTSVASEKSWQMTATTKNEPKEDSVQAKVYDPLMPYPEEYPEEYQTIQNGPAIIITRTTYTRVPDVTYTTVTMATLPTYQQVQKAEEGFAETLFDRKFHERSYTSGKTDSSTTSEATDQPRGSYFNINVKKIKDSVTTQASKTVKLKKSNGKFSASSTSNQSLKNGISSMPSLDENDVKIVQNFMNKNLKL